MELVPDDEKEPCDLCSEGTGMNDGVGWKIVMCPVHAAAPDLVEQLKWTENALRWAAQEARGRVKAEIVGGWLHHADKARAAIAEALGQ